jgi:purine nucleosidase
MMRKRIMRKACISLPLLLLCASRSLMSQVSASSGAQVPEKVIIDTDIGDDVDDAFAIGLALASPEIQIVGITSSWGNTALRAKMLDRFLCVTGRADIPVASGVKTESKIEFSQAAWARQGIGNVHPDAVAFILEEAKKFPGQITLIAIAPLTNVGAAIDKDPKAFALLKRIVVMGGSVRKGYDAADSTGPDAEYNIRSDIPAARKLFASTVPIFLMPLDSTMIPLDEVMRERLFTKSTPLTDTLSLLYQQWTRSYLRTTPTLFDAVPVAYVIRPELCPTTLLHIDIDDKGYTREGSGPKNIHACLQSDTQEFLHFYMPRLLNQQLEGDNLCRISHKMPNER